MTENQEKAIEHLNQYRDAKIAIRAIHQKIKIIEAKCNRVTRDPANIMQDSGRKDDKGGKIYVPMVVQQDRGNTREGYLDTLMDMRSEYWRQCKAAERLCMDIELTISERCGKVHAIILSMLYLYNCTLEQIAVSVGYCYAATKKHKWIALEEYGQYEP